MGIKYGPRRNFVALLTVGTFFTFSSIPPPPKKNFKTFPKTKLKKLIFFSLIKYCNFLILKRKIIYIKNAYFILKKKVKFFSSSKKRKNLERRKKKFPRQLKFRIKSWKEKLIIYPVFQIFKNRYGNDASLA